MRSVGRSGQAERGRVKGEAHVRAERKERESQLEHELLRKERARARDPLQNPFRNLIYSDKNKLFLNGNMH